MADPWENDPVTQSWEKDPAVQPWDSDPPVKMATWGGVFSAVPESTLGHVEKAAGGLLQSIGEGAVSRSTIPSPSPIVSALMSAAVERFKPPPGEFDTAVSALGADIADMGTATENAANPGKMDYWQRATLSGLSSAVTQVPAIAASIMMRNPLPAVSTAALQEKGSSYAETRQAGGDPYRAQSHSDLNAAAEALFEYLPMQVMLDRMAGPIMKTIFGTLAAEIPSEMLTTAVQSANDRVRDMELKNIPWDTSAYVQDILDTIGSVLVATPLTAGVGKGIHHAVNAPETPLNIPAIRNLDLRTQPEETGTITPNNSPQEPTRTEHSDGSVDVDGVQVVPPRIDVLTANITPTQQQEIDALIASLDADLITPEDVEASKKVIADHLAQKKAPPNEVASKAWESLNVPPKGDTALQDLNLDETPEIGAMRRHRANNVNYPNVNDDTEDRRDRVFSVGPEGSVGLTPRQVTPQASTYVLGEPTEDRNIDVLTAMRETVELFRQKYLPNDTIVISNEGVFSGGALGWYHPMGPKMHMIVPAVVRNLKNPDKFNPHTLRGAFYNLFHEVGHANLMTNLYGSMAPELASQIAEASVQGVVPEELLATLNPEEQALIREFNAMKADIMSKKMTAQEFLDKWSNPTKRVLVTYLGQLKVAPTDTALAYGKALVRESLKTQDLKEAIPGEKSNLALRRYLLAQFFSLDEFVAEQTARHAYATKQDEATPLGRFFSKALKSMRQFFADLKGANGMPVVVAPGTAFTAWMDGIPKQARVVEQKVEKAKANKHGKLPAKKAAKKATKKATPPAANEAQTPSKKQQAATKPKAAKPKPKVAKVQHNVETSTTKTKAEKARGMVTSLIRTGVLENMQDPNAKELMGYIKTGDWAEFGDLYAGLAGKAVKFQLGGGSFENFAARELYVDKLNVLRAGIPEAGITPALIAQAAQAWKDFQFRSPFYKAWFGDWENDAANASKIRRGAIVTPYGKKMGEVLPMKQAVDNIPPEPLDRSFGGEPLVVFHGTTAVAPLRSKGVRSTEAFTDFNKGDIGFHFGTVKAAHVRIMGTFPEQDVRRIDWARYSLKNALNEMYVIPAVLNIRNPLHIGAEINRLWTEPRLAIKHFKDIGVFSPDEAFNLNAETKTHIATFSPEQEFDTYLSFAPVRQALVEKGFDGLVYENTVEGDISFVAFHPNQVKSLLNSRTYSRSSNLHMELDFDASKQSHLGMRAQLNGVKNFVSDYPRLRRAMRQVLSGVYYGLELQQLAHLKPHISELSFMNVVNGLYNRFKSRLQAAADAVTRKWEDLGKENYNKLNKFLIAESEGKVLWYDLQRTTIQHDGKTRPWYVYVPNALTVQMTQQYGLDQETAALALEAKNVLLAQLNEAEFVWQEILAKRFANAGMPVLMAAMKPVAAQIHETRKRPYFPQGRFGNNLLIFERKKASGPGYEVFYKEHFENAIEWEKAWKKAAASVAPDERVRKEKVSDQTYVLMALPHDFIDLAASELGLSPDEVDVLMNILQPAKSSRILSTYDYQRLGIKGYSTEAMKSFANFTWHNANLLAKLKHRSLFNTAIQGVNSKLRAAKYATDPQSIATLDELQHVKDYMEKTRDYVMSPPNEAQMLRAFVSILYLGLNVKTALLNSFGLLTTSSDLLTRAGPVEGTKILAKATVEALMSIKLTSLNERRQGSYLLPAHQVALDRAIEEGVLSQSYAYHLAGMANGSNLSRLPASQLVSKTGHLAIDTAMYVFRLTELSTRRVSFLATYELESRNKQLSQEEVYQEAVRRTNLLQNDYSLGNRVPFMRGFKIGAENPLGRYVEPIIPLATVFMSFAQHMAFNTYGGYELGERRGIREKIVQGELPPDTTPPNAAFGYTAKLWVAFLLLAGYEGLPGAENLIDLIEILWRKFGDGKPIRQHLREMVQQLDVDPMLAARGLGHNVAGFDISRSIGTGRIVPGTDTLAHPRGNEAEMVGALALDLMGPTGGFIKFGLEALLSDKPKSEVFQHLPGGAGNIYTAYRWSQEGVLAPSRGQITFDLKTGQIRDLTAAEIWGKALGFNPTIVSQNREIRFNQYDQKVYWQHRRQVLMQDYWRALDQKDREAIADMKKEISKFNVNVPLDHKAIRITGADLHHSMQAKRKQKQADERQTTTSRKYRSVYQGVSDSYE